MRQPTLSLVVQRRLCSRTRLCAPNGRLKRALASYWSPNGCETLQTQNKSWNRVGNYSEFECIPQATHKLISKRWEPYWLKVLKCSFCLTAGWPLNYANSGGAWESRLKNKKFKNPNWAHINQWPYTVGEGKGWGKDHRIRRGKSQNTLQTKK